MRLRQIPLKQRIFGVKERYGATLTGFARHTKSVTRMWARSLVPDTGRGTERPYTLHQGGQRRRGGAEIPRRDIWPGKGTWLQTSAAGPGRSPSDPGPRAARDNKWIRKMKTAEAAALGPANLTPMSLAPGGGEPVRESAANAAARERGRAIRLDYFFFVFFAAFGFAAAFVVGFLAFFFATMGMVTP